MVTGQVIISLARQLLLAIVAAACKSIVAPLGQRTNVYGKLAYPLNFIRMSINFRCCGGSAFKRTVRSIFGGRRTVHGYSACV